MSYEGALTIGAQLGLDLVLIKPFRGIYWPTTDNSNGPPDPNKFDDIVAHATINEQHTDTLEITNHPVEIGASISDHAFKHPAEVVLQLGWSNSTPNGRGENLILTAAAGLGGVVGGAVGLAQIDQSVLSGYSTDQIRAIYQQLLLLQRDRILFSLYTGKRDYGAMLIKTISTETSKDFANSMLVNLVCQEVILVETQTVVLKKSTTSVAGLSSDKQRGEVSPALVGSP